jgi:hypothetical protein
MISDYFSRLVNQLQEYQRHVDPPYVHGPRTGIATTPDGDLEKLCVEIAGERPLPEQLREEVIEAIDLLPEDLSLNDFEALFQPGHGDEPERWFKGYLRSVEIHEAQRREENGHHPKAAYALVLLHSRVDEQVRKDLRIVQPGHQALRGQPEPLTDLALTIYQRFHGDLDDEAYASDDQFDRPADESQHPEFRIAANHPLLDHPRDRHGGCWKTGWIFRTRILGSATPSTVTTSTAASPGVANRNGSVLRIPGGFMTPTKSAATSFAGSTKPESSKRSATVWTTGNRQRPIDAHSPRSATMPPAPAAAGKIQKVRPAKTALTCNTGTGDPLAHAPFL